MMVFAHIRDNFAAAFFPRLSEWACAFAIFGVGTVLHANADLMANARTDAYLLMLAIADQASWAKGLIGFGLFRLIVLLINGAWRRSPHLRSVMAILSCFPLWAIAWSFLPSFGIAMVFAWVFLGMDVINAVRAAGDAKTVDHAHARGKDGRRNK
jgi:hypothetical protein